MKKPFSPVFVARLLLIHLGLWLGGSAAWAATLAVTPSAISNQYAGMITLAITGLTNGETVTMDKFLDANTNGVIDGGDLLGQRFQLTDNQVSLIGGATNVNVPGDSNPAVSNITTLLNFESIDLEHIVGSYLFKLSSPTARFTPVTNTFNITNSAYLQSFTGQVRSNGTATAVANAIVIVFRANTEGNFIGGTVANNSGNYTFKAPPGAYMLAAFKSNFVGDFTASAVSLGAGGTVTTNVNAIPATRTISGRVADAGDTNTPLPGSFVILESTNGLVAITFTDTNGNFNAPVTASSWKVSPQERDTALHGYVGFQSSIPVNTSAGSVSGVNILLPKGTAMIYGSIQDDLGNPLPGADVYGEDQDTYQYASDGVSDANGNYAVAALAGNWNANLSSDDPRLTNYVYSGNLGTTLLTSGQAVRQDFVLKRATNHITGYVRNNLSNPIAGVSVFANANINGTNFNSGNATTDGSGNYTLNVGNGTWQVGVSCGCSDCNDSLSAQGYQCVNNQPVTIAGNNGVANFTAQPCGPLQVTTTSLPAGTVNSFYSFQLQASGCNQPFTWSLSPGSGPLPSGINLNGDNLGGTPDTAGTYNFSVRVIDNNFNTADKGLSITINPGLQVITTSLPNGTSGVFYSQQLQATGGQLPYNWYLPGGSINLPPGINLSTSGVLSGTPGATGVFNFQVAVYVDNPYQEANQSLSLTINAGSSPLQVTTTSLANGTNGLAYNQSINATGGQPPYRWAVANYSADLPPNLTLATNGVLSGTLATSGGPFYFDVEVTDGAASTAYQTLSLYILSPPLPPLVITNVSLPIGTVGAAFSAQLGATGGQPPYTWSLATGSANPPPGLTLYSSGLISGTPTTNKVSTFKVQAIDANSTTTNKILSITINPKPTLTALNRTGNQFQLRLTGATGQLYTVQFATNLANPNWFSLLTTNPSATSVTIFDLNATNSARYYRARVEP